MRIVHVIGYFQPEFGYEETYTSMYQAALGHEVHVVTSEYRARIPGLSKQDRRAGVGTTMHRGVTVHRLPAFELPRDLIFIRGGLGRIKALAPDVVHAHGIQQPLNLALPRLKRGGRLVLIYDYHLDVFHFDRRIRRYRGWNPLLWLAAWEYKLVRRRLARRAIESAEAVLPTAPDCAEQLTSFFGISPERLRPVELAVDTERFDRDPEGGRAVREKLQIPADALVLLYPGTYTPRKRVGDLLPIVRHLGEGAHLLLVGDGRRDYMTAIGDEAHRMGIAHRVHRTGFRPAEELRRYFSAADLALFLSTPTVTTLEVMACGVPVVTGSGVRFQREAVLSGGGWVVDSDRSDRWPTAVERIVTDRAEMARRGEAARAYVRSERSYRAYAERLVALYRDCGASG